MVEVDGEADTERAKDTNIKVIEQKMDGLDDYGDLAVKRIQSNNSPARRAAGNSDSTTLILNSAKSSTQTRDKYRSEDLQVEDSKEAQYKGKVKVKPNQKHYFYKKPEAETNDQHSMSARNGGRTSAFKYGFDAGSGIQG